MENLSRDDLLNLKGGCLVTKILNIALSKINKLVNLIRKGVLTC